MAVSLALAGTLTWFLVSRLDVQNAQDQLAKNSLLVRGRIGMLETANAFCHSQNPVTRACQPPTEQQFLGDLESPSANLGLSGNRLILLDRPPATRTGNPLRQPEVIYDSSNLLIVGQTIPLGRETRVAGQPIREGTASFDSGGPYLVAATPMTGRYVSTVVLTEPMAQVTAQASGQLILPILLSAGAGLLLAIMVALLVSFSFTRSLRELRIAAGDIAGGNYSRRVRRTGRDEIGTVGRAFNGMAEAVERARETQRAFLANVSHELKTPLTSLIGFSQALMDGSLETDEERTRAATIIHEESERVLRMSQELLDLARAESGQLALHVQPVDLSVQLRQEIEIVRARAEKRGLTLQLAMPAWLSPVEADPDRLHQILENLLDNAVKYAPTGTTVFISAVDAPSGRVMTAVKNLLGSRPPDPARMFDRFYRADPSRSSAGGVGLGLSICRELAIAHGGGLTAELESDGSLCMKLDLPAAMTPVPPAEVPAWVPARLTPRALRGS